MGQHNRLHITASHLHHTDTRDKTFTMGFTDFVSETGLHILNSWVSTRSYIVGNAPSQADVKAFQQMKEAPAVEKYPHAYRWYKHIASFESEFGKLPGDASKDVTAYGPGAEELTINPAKAPQKKAGKAKPAAKSIVTLEVKPWDDETDMKALEESVRSIEEDGLVWGASKLVAVGFGIKKLQINLVVEDDKVSLDELQEEVDGFEDYVQSNDIAAMQKL